MEKNNHFTEDQLILIRDTFADLCEKSMERGDRESAQEEMEVVNAVQRACNYDEYANLSQFMHDTNGDWGEIGEKEENDIEDIAVKELVRFAKSNEDQPNQALKAAINAYLVDCWANAGRTRQDNLERREIAISALIIDCIAQCSREELKRLDRIKPVLADNF